MVKVGDKVKSPTEKTRRIFYDNDCNLLHKVLILTETDFNLYRNGKITLQEAIQRCKDTIKRN